MVDAVRSGLANSPANADSTSGAACQQGRISSPVSAARERSSPQKPSRPATERRKNRHVRHVIGEREQAQQRVASGWLVPQ
jgi:hypothetical protein